MAASGLVFRADGSKAVMRDLSCACLCLGALGCVLFSSLLLGMELWPFQSKALSHHLIVRQVLMKLLRLG